MDYQIILLLLVISSSIAGLAAILARARPVPRGWVVVYAICLLLCVVGWTFEQEPIIHGAAAIWFLFALLPGLLGRLSQRRMMQQQFASARRLARIVAWLHPADGCRELPGIIRAYELAQQGELTAAAETLRRFQEVKSAMGLVAVASLYRITNQWEELLAWRARQHQRVEDNLQVLAIMLRALGETGDVSGMVELYDSRRRQIAKLFPAASRDMFRLTLFVFCGRHKAVEELFAGSLAVLPGSTRAFWLATADWAAGAVKSAQGQLEELLPAADPGLRRAIERRLSHLALPRQPLDAAAQHILDEAEREQGHEEKFAVRRSMFSRRSLATQILIAANLSMFAVETCLGGSTDDQVLIRLGALYTPLVLQGEWWRMITLLFLHFGALHVAMNMFGLWLLGPVSEFALGFWRFLLVYLSAGIGSSAVVLLISSATNQPTLMVGASGSIMGLVGAIGALMLRGWQRDRAQVAKQRLIGILVLVAMQTVFDSLVPQVSMTAHLSGAVIGFAVTAILLRWMPAEN